jgi:hypothetical protein
MFKRRGSWKEMYKVPCIQISGLTGFWFYGMLKADEGWSGFLMNTCYMIYSNVVVYEER